MKLWNAMMFYATKKGANCPWTDSFVKLYRGEVNYAKQLDIPHSQANGEPHQGYHFLDSWCYKTIKENTTWYGVHPLDASMTKVYNCFKCIELRFWLAEVAGCDISKVVDDAIKTFDDCGKSRSSMEKVNAMVSKEIPWSKIETEIKKTDEYKMLVKDDNLYTNKKP